MALYTLKDVGFTYPTNKTPALRTLDLTVDPGAFVLVCGASGSGKTTLLRLLKHLIAPAGRTTGTICYDGAPIETVSTRRLASEIGFVFQRPAQQIVCDTVRQELAYGLENLGTPPAEIRLRLSETAAFFDLVPLLNQTTHTLSGGQQQLLNLAGVMAMRPKALLLDEPTAQLDPVSAAVFCDMLVRLNQVYGTTVIVSDHQLGALLPHADRLLFLEEGRLAHDGAPPEVLASLLDGPQADYVPALARFCAKLGVRPLPVSVKQAQNAPQLRAGGYTLRPPQQSAARNAAQVLKARDLTFRYLRQGPQVLDGLSLRLDAGETACLLGGNGSGKTTLLSLLAGRLKPLYGKVEARGRTSLLPQDPTLLFLEQTLIEDLRAYCGKNGIPLARLDGYLSDEPFFAPLRALLPRNPYDFSGGERQRAALLKCLLCEPALLLLDEPTKGLDRPGRKALRGLLRSLNRKGVAVLLATHDLAFAAHTDRCFLLFDGAVAAEGAPHTVLCDNDFYTTDLARLVPGALTFEDVAWTEEHR